MKHMHKTHNTATKGEPRLIECIDHPLGKRTAGRGGGLGGETEAALPPIVGIYKTSQKSIKTFMA